MTVYKGRWHGKRRYFGLHYDLHANEGDTELGVQVVVQAEVPCPLHWRAGRSAGQ